VALAAVGLIAGCSIGVPLPTRMTLEIPDDLDAGTWRVAYAAGDDVGAYVFEVA
jgi:hypothetical protein